MSRMTPDELRAMQAPLKEKYRQQPDAAKVTMSVRGELEWGTPFSCRIAGGPGSIIRAGFSRETGGDGTWACSAEMLLQALCGCAGVTFGAVCTAMRIDVSAAAMLVEGDVDYRGTLGLSREVPVGFQAIRLRIEAVTSADDATLAKAAELTERYCVVAQSLKLPVHAEIVRRSGPTL